MMARWFWVILFFCLIVASRFWGQEDLVLTYLKDKQYGLELLFKEQPLLTVFVYIFIYMLTVALSIPTTVILGLIGGTLFGVFYGTLFAAIANTSGATLAFLLSRFLLRDFLLARFSSRIRAVLEGLQRDGVYYLLSLRLTPFMPFFLVNLLMGLTPMRVSHFFLTSLVGVLPITLLLTSTGRELSTLRSLKDFWSPSLLLLMLGFALLPLIFRFFLAKRFLSGPRN